MPRSNHNAAVWHKPQNYSFQNDITSILIQLSTHLLESWFCTKFILYWNTTSQFQSYFDTHFYLNYSVSGTYPNTECHPEQPEWRSLHSTGSLQHSPGKTNRLQHRGKYYSPKMKKKIRYHFSKKQPNFKCYTV